MRQGQHKGRQRSRGRGRQGGSPANRVYESNGPDVKVRGTAQTIADKYLQLARDSVSSGDNVSAESYYQHAEHYLRIIAASQTQQQQQQQQHQNQNPQNGDNAMASNDEAGGRDPESSEKPSMNGSDDVPGKGPQPSVAEAASEGAEATAETGGFDGQAPDFLAKPVEIEAKAEKPKRGRRPAGRSKAKPEVEAAEADDAPAEKPSAPSTDAEVAAG